jgi:hypothetical protein
MTKETSMVRTLLALACVLSFSAFASTPEEAQRLFEKRGESPTNALAAADIYRNLASSSRDPRVQAEMKLKEAEAIYFVGYKAPMNPKEPKLRLFERGYTAADQASRFFEAQGMNSEAALAGFWYGSNLGKWGETNGVLASLRRWPELKARSMRIRELDPTVAEYGANRILGKAYLSIPFESNEEGLAFLQEAFDNTLVSLHDGAMVLSSNPVNNGYLLDAYRDRNRAAQFCDLYETFDDYLYEGEELWREVSPHLIPETYIEQQKFENDQNLHNYYSRNC